MQTKFLVLVLFLFSYACSVKEGGMTPINLNDFIALEEGDSIYFSKFEVTNIQYKGFLEHLKKTNSELFEKCKVDSKYWSKGPNDLYSLPYERNYFKHTKFDQYPVVNIPYVGAVEYCKWLNQKSNDNSIYRLPSKNEFEKLLNSVTIKYDSENPADYDKFHFNLKFKNDYVIDGGLISLAANNFTERKSEQFKYIQNPLGFYHIVGNVHEILNTGEFMGGSWDSFPHEVFKIQKMEKPDSRVGFRVVMVTRTD